VGARFTPDTWESFPEAGRFRNFFSKSFTRLANEQLEFTVSTIQATGDIANVTVQTRFDAVLTDSTPAENVTFATTDYMLFELQAEGWRLVRWDEPPPTG
jgi:ketosteroid isomerase-like protein